MIGFNCVFILNKKEPDTYPALFQLVDCMELIYILHFQMQTYLHNETHR